MEVKHYESYYENKLRLGIKQIGGLCLKLESPGYTGLPDRMILLPGGRVVFAELKRPGQKERRRQRYVQSVLRRYGFAVFGTVDCLDRISEVVAYCQKAMQEGGNDAADV